MKEFRHHFVKLSQGRIIKLDDAYWNKYWEETISMTDLTELNPDEIRHLRDTNLLNFQSLIYKLSLELTNTTEDTTPNTTKIISIIKLLIKFVPYLFELGDTVIETVFLKPFDPLQSVLQIISTNTASPKESSGSENLAYMLIKAIIKLLFLPDFTIRASSIWEPGIGNTTKYQNPDLIIEGHRSMLIRLLLVLCSNTMYHSPIDAVSRGTLFLTILVSDCSKQEVVTLTNSLMNVMCRSTRPENMMSFNDPIIKTSRFNYVNNCIQLLTLMVIYPLPRGSQHRNLMRLYLAKLNKTNELLYLGSCLVNGLKAEGGNPWNNELVMLLWELYQCNPKFKTAVSPKFYTEICLILVQLIKNGKGAKLSGLFLMYLTQSDLAEEFLMDYDQNTETTRDLLVMQICGILTKIKDQTLVSDLVEILYNLIPIVSKTPISGTNNPARKLTNTNPNGGLSYGACTSIINLISKFSNKGFLLVRPDNNDLLALLIRGVFMAALHNDSSRMLLFCMLKSEKVFEQVDHVISGLNEYFNNGVLERVEPRVELKIEPKIEAKINEEDFEDSNRNTNPKITDTGFVVEESPKVDANDEAGIHDKEHIDPKPQAEESFIEDSLKSSLPVGMTKSARSKQRKELPISQTFGGLQALNLTLKVLMPFLKQSISQILETRVNTFEIVEYLGQLDLNPIFRDIYVPIHLEKFKPLKFNWSYISLGWYLSILYQDIYRSHDTVTQFLGTKNKLISNITSMISWNFFSSNDTEQKYTNLETLETAQYLINCSYNEMSGTLIKLFKIEESVGFFDLINSKLTNPDKPSLNRRVSDLRLSGVNSVTSTPPRTPREEPESYFPAVKRGNSVSSLHSLNTLNRSRTNTPRNSISM